MVYSPAQIKTFGEKKVMLVLALEVHLRVIGQLSKHCLFLDGFVAMRCEVKDPFSSSLGS